MGGSIGKVIGKVGDVATRSSIDLMTGGLGEVVGGGISKKAGGMVGNLLSTGKLGGDTSSPSAPGVGGTVSPMQALMLSGGAPLLSSIAMGSDPQTAIASYFGVDPNKFTDWVNGLDSQSQAAITGLQSNLTNISNNTQMKQQAVQNLVNDFPNFMATEIPKYKGIADQATMDAANLALQKTQAKFAAGPGLSSGATAAAIARTGAEFGQANLQYGTEMAGADYSNKLNQAQSLLSFQQKMLGQGATQGFNAVQNMLDINARQAGQQAGLQFQQQQSNQQAQSGMFGAIGQLGGTLVGGLFGGPGGAWMGGQAGKALGGSVAPNSAGSGSGSMNLA